jgi:hypothetical protein
MTGTAGFTIQIEGPGLTLKREVEEPLVLKILGVLLGPKGPMFGATPQSAAQIPVSPPPVVANIGESPREYLDRSGAKRNTEKIAALGLYFKAQGTESFAAKDLRGLFVSAGEVTPKNLSRDIKDTVRAGWLAPCPDQQDRYYVTNRGEAAAAGGFIERPSISRRPNRSRASNGADEDDASARRSSRSGGGARAVLDELLLENYFAEPRTYHDIIKAASERGHRLRRTDLTQPLLNLVQSRPPKLRRQKVTIPGAQRPVWAYRDPVAENPT